ncbi:MAG: methyltransferase domain-containing protein [Gammaproteobacteria bacterium]|nr:methyltransferase domain-containing protein [Gammaproteobacteria bacterium]MDE2345869.1 methyltransferase domain-containing protein [Gammaproteobacteria bacterium]
MDSQYWDERYQADEYAYGREPNEFLRAEAARIPTGRILCLADGEGRNAVYLAGLGHQVTMVDFSIQGLRKAERLARERAVKLNLVHGDLAVYEPQGIFTGIVSIFAHVPQAARRRMHARLAQLLAPEGVFLLEAYTPRQPSFGTGGPRDPERLMTLEGLRTEVSPLRLILGRELEREVREGLYHTGMGATVQIIAVH